MLRNFAAALHSGLPDGKDENGPERNLRNWRNGTYLPDDKDDHRIFEVLFGDNLELAAWNDDLQNVLNNEREAKRQQAVRSPNITSTDNRCVPRPTVHFVGRQQEVGRLAHVLASVEQTACVLIQGGPGIGKTELTKAIAHYADVAARFGSRRYFAPLEAANSAPSMRNTIARAVTGDPTTDFAFVIQILGEHPALLVLDNLETPWEPFDQRAATEELLAELAALSANGVSLLASFRGRAAVGGARWSEHELLPLSPSLSATMFASIAGQWVESDAYLSNFIRALGGLPLAIDLVARRAHGRGSLAPLWREWQAIGAGFATRLDDGDCSKTSLAHSIELSLRSPRLSANTDAVRLFSLLGYLPAGICCKDRDTLLGTKAFSAEESLLRTGLAYERDGRLDLLPPIRDYARRNVAMAEIDIITWIKFYLLVGDGWEKSVEQHAKWSSEYDNIRAAELFDEFLKAREQRDDSLVKFQKSNDPIDRAKWLLAMADVEFREANYKGAASNAIEALSLFESFEDDVGHGDALTLLGRIEAYQSNFRRAFALFHEALDHYEKLEVRDDRREIDCLLPLTDVRDAIEMLDRSEDPGPHPGWRYIIPKQQS